MSARGQIPARQAFWRDPALPFIEVRTVEDGRSVCYDRHAHDNFSIGAITGGCSTYLNGRLRERVDTGAVVLMNPGEVHACSPLAGTWSYLMLYVDLAWLAALQEEHGVAAGGQFVPLVARLSRDPGLYRRLSQLHTTLLDTSGDLIGREVALHEFFGALCQHAPAVPQVLPEPLDPRLVRAADFIRSSSATALRLEDICRVAGFSASRLIRAFKAQYAMTPHDYLTHCRIQQCRQRLRRGEPLAQVAAETGFADQAHFQRAFRRYVAATPGEYRN
jgi:AraC-like DNA-binding protein